MGIVVVVAVAFAAGCAGARTRIVAPTAHYPISMSRAVRDADGTLVPLARRKVVGQFDTRRTAWGMVYSLVPLTPSKDLSDELDRQIEAVHGDAIVNLRVASETCGMNFAFLLDLLPIWPGCAHVEVTGDIIQVMAAAPMAPPAPPPPAPPPPAPPPEAAPPAAGGAP